MKLKVLKAGSKAFFAFHLTTVILIMVFAYIDETVSLYLSIFWILLVITEGILGLYQERLGILHTEERNYCESCGKIRKDKNTESLEWPVEKNSVYQNSGLEGNNH